MKQKLTNLMARRELDAMHVAMLARPPITRQTVRNIVCGRHKPAYRTIKAIARGLGVRIQDLL